MSTFDSIKEAITTLAERNGSSRQAIKKYVLAKKPDMKDHVFAKAIKSSVESGKLIPVKGSFKLAAAAKKPAKKATKAAGGKKATKGKKDPNKPKQGLSAYMFYMKANRQRIIDENEGIAFGEVGKKCGAEWSKWCRVCRLCVCNMGGITWPCVCCCCLFQPSCTASVISDCRSLPFCPVSLLPTTHPNTQRP
jgi:histone H1/5